MKILTFRKGAAFPWLWESQIFGRDRVVWPLFSLVQKTTSELMEALFGDLRLKPTLMERHGVLRDARSGKT
jgi:hypothetical protein